MAAIDTAILVTGVGLIAWVFLIDPQMLNSTRPLLDRLDASSYPLMDVLILAAALRLALNPLATTSAALRRFNSGRP